MKRILSLLAALMVLSSSSVLAKQPPSPAGTLIIIGGALRLDNSDVWNRIVQSAAQAKTDKTVPVSTETKATYRPKIAVFPQASGNPERAGKITADALTSYGADPFVVPVAISEDSGQPMLMTDEEMVEKVKNADGVYFTGGSQARITMSLRGEDGNDTAMLQAVWEVYRRGGCVAGTSAGAAVMSKIMYRDAKRVLPVMQNGVTMGKEVDQGLGFLDPAWFVEQHTLVRGRFARALVAMKSHDIKFGVGVDENTAVVVKDDDMEVIGPRGAIVMDLSEADQDKEVKGFNVKNVKLTFLDNGDKLKLSTLDLTPSEQKQAGAKLDPKSPDFKPEEDERLFSADILGNSIAVDLMCRMMRNRHGEALGLAFDASTVREGPAQGFEFRFYRGDDTIGWCCQSDGGDCYTVRNVRLDIRPIEISGPLYK